MAVLWVLVYADVENVFVAWSADSAGEEILQVIMMILRVPRKRPSTVS